MPNELLLIISLVVSYSLLLAFFKLFGKYGLYVWLGISTILANIEVTILVVAFGMEQTLGNALFASTFLATDILSEIYGKKDSQKGAYIGIMTLLVFMFFSFFWQIYTPSANDWAMPSVKGLFGNTPRMLLASLFGFAISECIDVHLYHRIWELSEKKWGSHSKFLWLRNNGSTLISQFINIFIFNFGAFWAIYDFKTLVSITLSCYVIYVFTSLLDTPFVYIARKINKV